MLRRIRSAAAYGLGSILTTLGAIILLAVSPPMIAAAGGPYCSGPSHWYAQAQSGCCSYGTGLQTVTPAHWSVYRPANSTTDEAAWLIDQSNTNIAIEAGYYSGYFVYNNSWTNSIVSYITLNNGTCCGTTGGSLAASTGLFMDDWAVAYIGNCGPEGADVGGNHFRFCYNEPPGINFGQGEVTASASTWMGGGSGEGFTAYWTPDHTHYYPWGFINGCYNAPYWLSVPSGDTYSNGGY